MSLPRYAEYKDSGVEWLGSVPEHWEICTLKRIASLRSGESITAESIEPEGAFPVYGGNGLRGYTDGFTHEGHFVLVGRQGALCGNVNYAYGKFWASEHAVVATPVKKVSTTWLGELLRAMNLNQYSVSAAQPGLSVEAISNLGIPVPPLAEQTEIAGFVEGETARIDALIAEQETLLALLAEKRQATISHAVTRGLDPDVPMKDSGIAWLGEVPAHWRVDRFKASVAFAKNGIWGAEPCGDESDIPCVRVADFDRRALAVRGEIPTIRNVVESERVGRVLQRGDLLLEKSGGGENQPVGQVVLYDHEEPAVCSNFVARVRLREGMDSRFWRYLHAAAYSVRINTRAVKQTSGIQNLDQDQYFSEHAVFPPHSEQCAISDFLDQTADEFDLIDAEVTRAISLLKERRIALISAAVTGQIDVRGLASEEAA